MSEYTQGVCHDGAAILKDGQPLTVEQILEALRERDALKSSSAVTREALSIAITSLLELYRAAGVGQVSETFQQAAALKALSTLNQDRATLSAYVNRLRSALNYSSKYLDGNQLNTIGHGSKAHMEMVAALAEAPGVSLSTLKMQWHDDVLEALATDFKKAWPEAIGKHDWMVGRMVRLNQGAKDSSLCPDCEGNGNIAFVTCPICDGEGKLSSDEVARLHTERLAAEMDSCELECGAYSTYCKCAAEAQQ